MCIWVLKQPLFTSQVSHFTSDGGASAHLVSSCPGFLLKTLAVHRSLGIVCVWVLPWVGLQGDGPFMYHLG